MRTRRRTATRGLRLHTSLVGLHNRSSRQHILRDAVCVARRIFSTWYRRLQSMSI